MKDEMSHPYKRKRREKEEKRKRKESINWEKREETSDCTAVASNTPGCFTAFKKNHSLFKCIELMYFLVRIGVFTSHHPDTYT